MKSLAEAKRSWVALTKPEPVVAAQPADLAPYLKQGQLPVCPTGGTYNLGAVNEPPTILTTPGPIYGEQARAISAFPLALNRVPP
ncbi:MAG: hypothetical protein B9S33_02025 [Pedosphaera sp. Tous-C6FEB]|nr:MAG: hypothetical protein B9S33_02025 [Pedosphaera sp. Tous-C6FEB]